MNPTHSAITLTFGDQAENHVGMEQIGQRVAEGHGFSYEDLTAMYDRFVEKGVGVELYHLHEQAGLEAAGLPPAYLLVIRTSQANDLLDKTALFEEQAALPVDKKAWMYGRVVNKTARWNLCFDDEAKEPAYEEGRGRVVAWDQIPRLKGLYAQFPDWFGPKAVALKGEGNYYYDVEKCGIGFHGDTERRKVIALRLGASLPLYYQWWRRGETVGPMIEIDLAGGDMYVMSEKAVGTDWKQRSVATLRHGAGAGRFVGK